MVPAGHAVTDGNDSNPAGEQPVGDIFDNLDALRVDQNYGSGLRTRKPFTSAPSGSREPMSGSGSAAT